MELLLQIDVYIMITIKMDCNSKFEVPPKLSQVSVTNVDSSPPMVLLFPQQNFTIFV